MIEFAKHHVEEALRQALENIEIYHCNNIRSIEKEGDPYISDEDGWHVAVDKDSILNAYPLEKIK